MDLNFNSNSNSIKNSFCQNIDDYAMNTDNAENDFKILYFNAQSISSVSKFNNFKEQLFSIPHKIHVVAIGESWIQNDQVQLYKLPGYNNIFSCRDDGYGGVAVYISDDLEFDTIEIKTGYTNSIEVNFPKILINCQPLCIYAFYRSQKCSINEFLLNLESKLEQIGNQNVLILGDSNIDTKKIEGTSQLFVNICESNYFTICNNNITRRNSKSIIDHVICNFLEHTQIEISTIDVDKTISDHNFLLTKLQLKVSDKNYIFFEKKYVDFDAVVKELASNFHCNIIDTFPNSDDLCEFLITELNKTVTKYTTVREIKIRLKYLLCPWVNSDLIRLIKLKKNLRKKHKKQPENLDILDRMNRISTLVNKCMKSLRDNYYLTKFNLVSGNPKSTWRELNTMLGRKEHVPINKIVTSDETFSKPKDIAEVLNNYFADIGKNMSDSIKSNPGDTINKWDNLERVHNDLVLTAVDINEVIDTINKLESNKSCGYDGITVKCVKICKEILAPPLTRLINICFQSGKYPDVLKIQKITPIFKNGEKTKLENYRPISVLPIFNKIIEKIIFERIYNFLESENFFYNKQFGFRPKMSTSTAAVELMNMIIENIESRMIVGGVFLDLSKAFDTINHSILLKKLNYAGIRGSSFQLLENYLYNRTQCVSIGGMESSLREVNIGVPQGSVLGPLLFLVYINDMAKIPITGTLLLFADDSSLFYPSRNEHTNVINIEHDLVVLFEYFRINKLSVNVKKTKFIQFRAPHRAIDTTEICINGNVIQESKSLKYLGLIINNTLDWNQHIEHITNKISPVVGIMRKFRNKLPTSVLRLIYFSLVQSHISYMLEIYGSQNGINMKTLQRLQNKAIKHMYRLDIRTSTLLLYSSISRGILPIKAMYIYELGIWMYKNIQNKLKSNLYFQKQQHDHATRTQSNLCLPKVRTNYAKQRIEYIGSLTFNSIPVEIKSSPTVSIFKNKLKTWIIDTKLETLI